MASAPRRGSRTVLVWALGLWLVAGVSMAGGIWIALRKPEPPLTGQNYYVLQWTQMSNCSVVTSLPDWGQFRQGQQSIGEAAKGPGLIGDGYQRLGHDVAGLVIGADGSKALAQFEQDHRVARGQLWGALEDVDGGSIIPGRTGSDGDALERGGGGAIGGFGLHGFVGSRLGTLAA